MSPPARGRGSKRQLATRRVYEPRRPLRGGVDRNVCVALADARSVSRPPRGGVDRNCHQGAQSLAALGSPPARGRGSKPPADERWHWGREVAPCAGAWIETSRPRQECGRRPSPPARGRGSKLGLNLDQRDPLRSPPARGRGSKQRLRLQPHRARSSPPARGRGSKLLGDRASCSLSCRPLRGGVDRNATSTPATNTVTIVAPCAGAWIETSRAPWEPCASASRPLRGGVDRNWTLVNRAIRFLTASPPALGRGSKHEDTLPEAPDELGHVDKGQPEQC